ncbi:MAG: phage gp6-like head-tail connector protein [Bacteroidales bacterium]|nr:phage gp6-like head-tail connector protein [Bacteroidales bacterium]
MRKRDIDSTQLAFCLGRLKSHLRITSNDLDGELVNKLVAAFDSAEHQIGRVIPLSTITDTLPLSETVALGRPLISVDGIRVDGTTVDVSGCEVDVFAGTVTLPEDTEGKAVEVTYQAGMQQIPADLVAAILLIASSLFSNPMDSVETLPKASSRLLRPYRNYEL